MVNATGTTEAIEKISSAIGQNQLPLIYLLGERYVDSLNDMATSNNAKLILLPADIPAAVRGLMNAEK